MEQICENNNYQLLITSWVRDLIPKINKIYPSKHFVKPISFQPWDVTNLKKFTESHYSEMGCGHPNEKGYTLIAQNLYEVIIKNHQNFIQGNEKLEIEMIYDGDVVDWKKNKSII